MASIAIPLTRTCFFNTLTVIKRRSTAACIPIRTASHMSAFIILRIWLITSVHTKETKSTNFLRVWMRKISSICNVFNFVPNRDKWYLSSFTCVLIKFHLFIIKDTISLTDKIMNFVNINIFPINRYRALFNIDVRQYISRKFLFSYINIINVDVTCKHYGLSINLTMFYSINRIKKLKV